MGLDYILSLIKTRNRLVSEPCPFMSIVWIDVEGPWLRITQSITLLPLGSAINRVPPKRFRQGVVVMALRDFPQFDRVAF